MQAGFEPARTAQLRRILGSAEPFRDDFFRTEQLASPEKTTFYPHHDAAVLFREICRLETDHAVQRAIDRLLWFDLFHIESMQDLHQRMECVLQIVAPLCRMSAAFRIDGSGVAQLFGESGQIVKQKYEIVNEGFLERLMQEVVAIFQKLIVQRVEELLTDAFRLTSREHLLLDILQPFRALG